jgi:hypothetical protein
MFHPSRLKSARRHPSIAPAVVALPRLPACHRDDWWGLALAPASGRRAHQRPRGPRGLARPRSGRFRAGLPGQEPGARWAVADAPRALDAPGVEVEPWRPRTRGRRRAQTADTRRGRVWPVAEDHQAPAPRTRRGPHHGGITRPRRVRGPGAEGRAPAPALAGHRPSRLARGPTARQRRPGLTPPAVGVAPPCGAGLPIAADAFIPSGLRRLVALHALRGDARGHALPRRTARRRGDVNPAGFRRGLRGRLARRRRRAGARTRAPAWDLDHGAPGPLPPAVGTTGTAVADRPATARLLATLREAGRVMSRDQGRARVPRPHPPALRHVWPVTRRPTRPCHGAVRVVAVATPGTAGDATAPHTARDAPRGQELPRWSTEPRPLVQDGVDKAQRPCTGERGRGQRSPPCLRAWPHV